jgi:hypothetical protein
VRGEARQHRQHQSPCSGTSVELLSHAADPNAQLFEVGYGIQNQAGFAPEAIQPVHQKLIEPAEPGVAENLATLGAPIQWNGPGDSVVGVDAENWQSVHLAEALTKVVLRLDGLTLALFFRADSRVNGYGHKLNSDIILWFSNHMDHSGVARMQVGDRLLVKELLQDFYQLHAIVQSAAVMGEALDDLHDNAGPGIGLLRISAASSFSVGSPKVGRLVD